MSDLSEQEKLERRRARRQQRILASKESRLSKITGTQSAIFRETPSPSPSPSTSTSSIPPKLDSDQLETPWPKTIKSQKHRPIVQKLIEEEQANELNEKGFLGGKIPGLLLASMLRKTSSRPRQSANPINKYWNVLHFVCMVWLGTLAMYEFITRHGLEKVPTFFKNPTEHDLIIFHYPVFWHFITLELLLYFGRSIYQPGYYDQAEVTGINLSNQLPAILQKPASTVLKHGNVFVKIYRDLFIVIFVIGFSSLCISLFL